MAKSKSGLRVYLQNQMHVQMAATQEHPGGRVVTLNQGWNELDEDMAAHPVLSKLIPESDSEGKRRERLADADEKRRQAHDEAEAEYNEVAAECQREQLDERNKLAEEHSERAADAQKRGVAFNERHPDPDAQHAIAITGGPAGHMVSASSMANKPEADEGRKKEEEALPSEGEQRGKQNQRARLEDEHEGSGMHDETREGDEEEEGSDKPRGRRARAKTEG